MNRKRFSASARESVLGSLVDNHITDGANLLNAVEFAESPQGLGISLYPVQRVLLKLIFGIPMDWDEKEVPVYDVFCENLLYTFKETEYIRYVADEGRIMITDWREADPEGYNEIDCIVGRRGGKSQLVSAIMAYKLYRLLNLRSPQEYFGLVSGSPIDLTILAQDAEGSSRLYDKLKEDVNRCSFFAPFIKGSTSEMTFVSEADRFKRDITPSIKAMSFPCLKETELIWTTGGLKAIKDVSKEDIVYDLEGKERNISNIYYNESPLINIELSSFRKDPLSLTPEHTCLTVSVEQVKDKIPFIRTWGGRTTLCGDYKYGQYKSQCKTITIEEKKAKDLKLGDYFLYPVISEEDRVSPDNLPFTPTSNRARPVFGLPLTENACRLYGLYLAEGNLAHDLGYVKFTFHIKEADTLAKFTQTQIKELFGFDSTLFIDEDHTTCDVICSSSQLAKALDFWFGHGCANKHIPPGALRWTSNLQSALIEGYDWGDGTKSRSEIPTVSRSLAYGIYGLIIQTGRLASIIYKPAYLDKHGDPHRECWTLAICSQERHYRFFHKIGDINYFWTKIVSLETEEVSKVVDLEVEGSHSFLTKCGVTHNCTTNAVRGPSSYVLALDEFAFYRNQVGVNSEEIYKAAAPATMQFKAGGVREGKRESMILIITSPNGRIGKYYQLYQSAMRMGNDSDILAFRCSTSEMNPRSDVAFLKKEFRENPDSFKAEYGGNFLEAAESYVKLATMNECVDLDRPNKIQFEEAAIGRKYFWGLDLGMKHDATALSISHWEPNPSHTGATLVFDYIDRIMVGEGDYVGFKELPLDDLLKWLTHLNRYYPCFKGATDQHGGAMFVQLLESIEIHGLELVHLTSGINSQMYLTMKGLMEQRNIRFPNEEKFINELKLVEASYVGKYQIRVEAPDEKDAHDDMCDSTALCSWVAQQWALNEGSREFRSLLEGNSPIGPQIPTGWDVNAPLSVLRSQDRMMQMQMRSSVGVQNPFRRR